MILAVSTDLWAPALMSAGAIVLAVIFIRR
jgi:hypothetical protein